MSIMVGLVAAVAVVVAARPRVEARGRRTGRQAPSPGRAIRAVGTASLRHLPDRLAVGPSEAGWTVIASGLALVLLPPLVLVAPTVVLVRSSRRRRAAARADADAVQRGLPELIDLLALGVGAGLTVRDALAVAVAWTPAPLGAAFADAVRRGDAGEPFVESLETVVSSLGPGVRPLVTVLIAAERDGAALVPALERASDEARRRRRVEAEEAARRVPVLMLFPLVLCVLPAFAVLTVVPVLIGTLSDLQLPSAGP
jgi:Flp pilus assembly protein TadB